MSLLLDKAKVWRRKRLLRELRAGAGRLVFLGVPVLTAALWLDRLAVLPQSARAVLWLAGLAAVAAGAYVRLVRPWRSNSWRAVFEEAAKELPGMRDFLWPAWELREAAPAHTSPELARAHLEATLHPELSPSGYAFANADEFWAEAMASRELGFTFGALASLETFLRENLPAQ